MLKGTVVYKTVHEKDGTPYNAIFHLDGADTFENLSLRISTSDYEAVTVMNGNPEWEELQTRRMNVGTARVKVETVMYEETQKNGVVKTKARPVNNDFFVRLASTIRYAKSKCTSKNSEDFTGVTLISTAFYPNTLQTYHIPDGEGNSIGTVKLDKGIILEMDINTSLFDIHIKEDPSFSMEVFNDFKVSKLLGMKETEEYLGFKPVEKVKELGDSESLLDVYKDLDEVIKYNPEREFEWLRGKDYHIVTDETLDEVCKEIYEHEGYVIYDTETTGLNITFKSREGKGDILVGVVLSVKFGTSYFFPVNMRSIKNLCGGDDKYFMEHYMRPILEEKELVAHNMAFDWKVAYIYDINCNIVHDTMALFKLTCGAEISDFKVGLKDLTRMFLGRDSLELSDLVRDGSWGDEDSIKFWDLPEELVRYYAPADTDNTLGLLQYAEQNDLLHKYNATKTYEIEIAFSYAVAYQEFYGHCTDVSRLGQLEKDVAEGLERSKAAMEEIVGHTFNPNSPKELMSAMYDELGIPKQISRKTGKPTTDKEAIKALASMTDENDQPLYPFVQHLTEFRSYDGLRKNFIKNLPTLCTEDGFMFSHVMQYGTTTGRVSINTPNYQSYNDTIKKYIVPRNGYYATDQDYSSVEYRVLGNMSGNEMIKQGFVDPDFDYHQYQAARMYNVPYASVTKKMRKRAKSINFGLPYGMGDESLGVSVFGEKSDKNTKQAAALRKKYFEGQEDIQDFFEKARAGGVKNGYTETFFGRRRYYNRSKFSDAAIRRQAGNHRIQGSAADIYKLAVGRLFKRICKEGWLGKVLFTGFIHDEIFCEVHNSIDPMKWLKVTREEFEVKIKDWCPLYMGFGFGMCWYEAKSVELPIRLQWELVEKYGENGYPEWHGDGYELARQIPVILRDFHIRDCHTQLTEAESQGKCIKPALNSALFDVVATDAETYNQVMENYEEGADLTEYIEKLKEGHVEGVVRVDGKVITKIPKINETQMGIDYFCQLHCFDRSEINVLNIEEETDSGSATVELDEDESYFSDTEEELDELREQLEQSKDARIQQLGLYLDTTNNEITLNMDVPQTVIAFVQRHCVAERQGYRILFKSYVQKKNYTTEKYLPANKVNIVQQMYIKAMGVG